MLYVTHDTFIRIADLSRGISLVLCVLSIVQIIYLIRAYRKSVISYVHPFPVWAVVTVSLSFIVLSLVEIYPHIKYFGQAPVLPNWVVSPFVFLAMNVALAAMNSNKALDLHRDD